MSRYSVPRHEQAQLRIGPDQGKSVIPIDSLLPPNIAAGALVKFGKYCIRKSATRISLVYRDLLKNSAKAFQA